VGTAIKPNSALCDTGNAGEKGACGSVLIFFEIFYSGNEISVAHSKFAVAHKFSSAFCSRLEN
jgi:hypothetical protein